MLETTLAAPLPSLALQIASSLHGQALHPALQTEPSPLPTFSGLSPGHAELLVVVLS